MIDAPRKPRPIRDVHYLGHPHHVTHFLHYATSWPREAVYFVLMEDSVLKVRYRQTNYVLKPFEWMTLYDDGTIIVSLKKKIAIPVNRNPDW